MADDNSLFGVDQTRAYSTFQDLENDDVVSQGNQSVVFQNEKSGGHDPFSYELDYDMQHETMANTRVGHQEQIISDCWMQNNLGHNTNANSLHNYKHENQEQITYLNRGPINRNPHPISKTFSDLLRKYRSGKEIPKNRNMSSKGSEVAVSDRRLSTEEIIRVAGDRYIQFSNQKLDAITTFIHPYGSVLSSLSAEEAKGTDLVHLLLSAAEKVGNSQYDSANSLLTHCESLSSELGNPVERIASYFAEGLRERISRETGSSTRKQESEEVQGPNGLATGVDMTILAMQNEVPFTVVMQFAATQTILDNLAVANKIHIIDLHIRSGIQWIPLIQALSERKSHHLELLKITALDTKDKQKVEEIGKKLQSFAESFNIPFSFKVVSVSNIKALDEEHFEIKYGESVAVYAPTILRTMIPKSDILEGLMRVIGSLRPLIMVVNEVESSDNSPIFVNRFIEALFFYSAWFDCLEDCMERDNLCRAKLERFHFGRGIVNTIATEGEERITRSVKINVWRSYFARFKMVEVELRKSSFEQANLLLKQHFSCANSCNLDKDGKCMIVGWKGTPMFSVSAWKFK